MLNRNERDYTRSLVGKIILRFLFCKTEERVLLICVSCVTKPVYGGETVPKETQAEGWRAKRAYRRHRARSEKKSLPQIHADYRGFWSSCSASPW